MKIYVALALALFLLGCQKKNHIQSGIESIEVFKFPENVLTPISVDRESIKLVEPYLINNQIKIDSIRSLINSLEKFGEEYFEGSLVLCCVFHFKDSSKKELLYDRGEIVFDEVVYYSNNDLIKLLSTPL